MHNFVSPTTEFKKAGGGDFNFDQMTFSEGEGELELMIKTVNVIEHT